MRLSRYRHVTTRTKIMAKNINVTIKFWKQNGPKDKGHFDTHELKNIPDDTSYSARFTLTCTYAMLNKTFINESRSP